MTKRTFTLPNMGPMLARWDREAAALRAEPYTVRAGRGGYPAVAKLGDRAYYTYGTNPEDFRMVDPLHAAELDAAYAELHAINARIHDIARRAATTGRHVTADECTAAQSRVYGDNPE